MAIEKQCGGKVKDRNSGASLLGLKFYALYLYDFFKFFFLVPSSVNWKK